MLATLVRTTLRHPEEGGSTVVRNVRTHVIMSKPQCHLPERLSVSVACLTTPCYGRFIRRRQQCFLCKKCSLTECSKFRAQMYFSICQLIKFQRTRDTCHKLGRRRAPFPLPWFSRNSGILNLNSDFKKAFIVLSYCSATSTPESSTDFTANLCKILLKFDSVWILSLWTQ